MQGQSLSRSVQERLGLPDTTRFTGPFPFKGMNQQASRLTIDDAQAFWLENLIKIGDGNMRSVPDVGAPLLTVPAGDTRRIIYFYWFTIGLFDYVAVFFDDGSAIQIERVSGTETVIATPGSGVFYLLDSPFPATVGWGNLYLLISNNNTKNDYWAWDGRVLYGAGTISPQVTMTATGNNYIGPPTITVFGGSGSGVVLQPVIDNGSIVALTVIAPGGGYTPGDTVQVAFSGGGADESAILQANLQPTTVNQVVVLAGGANFTTATVGFSGGGGSGAAATANLSGGSVASVTLTNPGSGYTSAPTVSITGDGSGAQAQATLVASGVDTITVVNGGTNFFGVPTLSLRGGFGSGATAAAILSGPGPLASVTLDIGGGGTGYTAIPNVVITDGGAGTGATAIVSSIQGGVITGLLLTDPGDGYTSPVVTIDPPASGITATATAAVSKGSIQSVTVDNHGGGYTDAPAVIVQPGLNGAASATLDLMPFGVSGTSIETYQSQVWVQDPYQPPGAQPTGGDRVSSAPDSISDFATSSGGLAETVTSRFLRRHLTAIHQANGFLYPIGDSSVNVISNVQVSGDPPTKSLTNLNTDPQTGTHWRDSVQDFDRTIMLANRFGVFGLYGGALAKVSGIIDNVFLDAIFPDTENPVPGQPPTPSGALANLYNRKVYLLLMSVKDPFTRTHRPAMVAWTDGGDWSIISQSVALTFIGTQEINSDLTAWGTDGTALYPLMQTPSERIPKIWSSKLYGAQNPYITKLARMVYVQAENFASDTEAPEFGVTIDTEWGSLQSPVPTTVFPPPLAPPGTEAYRIPAGAEVPPVQAPVLAATAGQDMQGQQLGMTITTAAADFSILNLMLAYDDNQAAIFG
jgi:hypothetical protein